MVAFVIVLVFMVFGWIKGGLTDPAIEQTEEKITKQFDCDNIEIDVTDACVDDVNNAEDIKMNVDVVGDSAKSWPPGNTP